MPNQRVVFITTRTGGTYGSSLYMVTAHWVLRCSGNNAGGRRSTTFIRKRSITYDTAGISSNNPTVGSAPVEGGHTGNNISAVVSTGATLTFPTTAPASWVSTNGVSWATAVSEIDAAAAYARRTGFARASREVGSGVDFAVD